MLKGDFFTAYLLYITKKASGGNLGAAASSELHRSLRHKEAASVAAGVRRSPTPTGRYLCTQHHPLASCWAVPISQAPPKFTSNFVLSVKRGGAVDARGPCCPGPRRASAAAVSAALRKADFKPGASPALVQSGQGDRGPGGL